MRYILDIEYWNNLYGSENIDTDKLKEYLNFIIEKKVEYDTDEYTENHHIIPRSINFNKEKDNINLVRLLAKDHFLCHKILANCFINGKCKAKMSYAYKMMCLIGNTGRDEVSEEDYSEARKLVSESQLGENNPMYGKHISELCRIKVRENIIKYNKSENKRKIISESNKNRVWTEESKKKVSKSLSGEGNYWFGKKLSEDHIRKMSDSRKNKVWVNNGIDNLFVSIDSLDEYLSNGFIKGLIKSGRKERIKNYRKIILCGVDGAGKSTIANKIVKDSPEMNYKIVHCTRHTPNTYEYFRDLFLSEENIIFDRGPYGQFVYQNKREREARNQLTILQLYDLEKIIREYNIEVWYVYADLKTCLINCKKDSDDNYYNLDYIKSLDSKFRNLFDSISTINVKYIFNDYVASEIEEKEIDYFRFDYSTLPKVIAVDFDGTLVIGSQFPEIGELNCKLVHELFDGKYKDWKKVLFTHRAGDTLIEACNFLAQNNLYFDAINDDIPEVKEKLKRNPVDHRKIWFDEIIDDKARNVSEFL